MFTRFFKIMYLLSLCCCVGFSQVVASRGYSLDAVRGLLIAMVSLAAELWGERASIVVAHGLSCSLVCGIFPDQGSNLCLLHWQAVSLPLSHKGRPRILEWVAYPFSRGSSQPRNRTGVSHIAVDSLPAELLGKPVH